MEFSLLKLLLLSLSFLLTSNVHLTWLSVLVIPTLLLFPLLVPLHFILPLLLAPVPCGTLYLKDCPSLSSFCKLNANIAMKLNLWTNLQCMMVRGVAY